MSAVLSGGWPGRLRTELAGALAAALACLALAWAIAWLGLATQAAAQQQALLRERSPIGFDFAAPGQLIGGQVEGARSLRQDAAGIELELGPAGANLGLNFRGRVLDPAVYGELRLQLASSAAATLVPIRSAAGQAWAAATAVALAPAAQRLQLRWTQFDWQPLAGTGAAGQPPARVDGLRLYLGGAPGTRVRLQALQFRLTRPPPPTVELQPLLARPETWLAQLDQLAAGSPAATARPPGFPLQSWLALPAPWWQALALLAAASCAAVLLALRRHGPLALRAGWTWSLWSLPVLALWIGDDLRPILLLFLLAGLWTGLRQLPPAPPALAPAVAWRQAALLTVLLLALLALLPGARLQGRPDGQDWIYPAWALLQQVMLQRLLYARLRLSMTASAAAWTAAAGFALWHAPNSALMLLTLLGGRLWCGLYERGGRVLPVACSHALVGLAALAWLRPEVLRSAEVSARFLGLAD